jgi:hypothetical protein
VRRDTDYALIDDAGPEGEAARTSIGRRLGEMLYPEWNSLGIALGYRYSHSPVIVGDGTPEPADDPSDYVQTSRPGHRAPHAWLADGRSTLELFGRGFVMLCLGSEPALASALLDAADAEGVPLQVVCAREPEVARVYERPWVLVRPDGQVAWRGDALPDDPLALLRTVCGKAAVTTGEGAPE